MFKIVFEQEFKSNTIDFEVLKKDVLDISRNISNISSNENKDGDYLGRDTLFKYTYSKNTITVVAGQYGFDDIFVPFGVFQVVKEEKDDKKDTDYYC